MGSAVTVSGTGFRDDLESGCRFQVAQWTYYTPARWLSDRRLTCFTPSVLTASFANVEVSMNGQDFSISAPAYKFEFYSPAVIQRITPSLGPLRGGTNVTLIGNNFNRAAAGLLTCRFNATVVTASVASSTEIHCISPSNGKAGFTLVEVSHNLRDFTAEGGMP